MIARQQPVRMGLVFACVLAGLISASCKKTSSGGNASLPNSGADQISFTNLELITDTEEKQRDKFEADVRSLALKGDFQKLESMATDYRSNKSRFKNGYWKLRAFYVAFGDYEKIDNDEAYTNLIGQLEHWVAEQPNSITPRLALVETYHGYSWVARGGGGASEVTEQGERLMEERIEKGFNWLHEAQKLQAKDKDPAFYATALHLCLGANVDRETYEKIFDAGVQNAPDYNALYEYKAYYLLPRWYGQEGEWETFTRKISERKDIPGSEEIFARVALYLRDLGLFYEEFPNDDQSWEELKSSFHAIEKNYPDSLEVKSILCLISAKLCDYKEARAQMKLLDGKVDLSVWSTRENFLEAVGWLNNNDAALEAQRQQFKTQRHQSN
jgi:hypothetical protein